MSIAQNDKNIILENEYARIVISSIDTAVESVTDKVSGREIKGDNTHFISVITQDKETVVFPQKLECEDNIITVKTMLGDFKIKVDTSEKYFTFELVTELPEKVFKLSLAHIKYSYDCEDKSVTGASGIALTYWANPCFYPDAKDLETKAEVIRHLRDKGAKYALIIAPINMQKDIIKQVSRTIEKGEGIMSEIGGAWGRDSRLNFGNYMVQYFSSPQFIQESMNLFEEIGVDQIDFHKGSATTFRQGDFKFAHYADAGEFKKTVSDALEAKGMSAGLHTYSFYIDYDCDSILSDPKCQKDFGVLEAFTLAEDIDENTELILTAEGTENVEKDYGFMKRTTPFILIGNEMIKFENQSHGFKAVLRGAVGTVAAKHKKGEKVYHIDGYYHGVAPVPGSDLFFKIARNTAKAFNEGGFKMIYLDALDGIRRHCDDENESWYYCAAFVNEVLKHCNTYPLIEYSTIYPSIWPARGRIGAYDAPFRSYKIWNRKHAEDNKKFIDRYSAPTLGWYMFYPTTDRFPGNEHTKYHHTDAVEYMGSLALMHDYSIVFLGPEREQYEKSAGLRRNISIYKKYDKLRKEKYFSEEVLEKIRNGKWEYHIAEKENGKYVFVEKDYQKSKLYDLSDDKRNSANYENPFGEQTPFIRIEAMMSTAGVNAETLMKIDEAAELEGQKRSLGSEVDYSNKLAKKVSVLGNGKKGSAVAIKLRCATNSEKGYALYIIDTDFEGWRDFILLEADNGERADMPFDDKERFYAIYRSGFNNERVTDVEIETAGDTKGVKMSDIVVAEHTYEVLKNPTVKIGDSEIVFNCELMSSDFIEFDGKTAKVIDRNANEKIISYSGSITAPNGDFEAKLTAQPLNRTTPRAQLTFGFTGKEI